MNVETLVLQGILSNANGEEKALFDKYKVEFDKYKEMLVDESVNGVERTMLILAVSMFMAEVTETLSKK